MPSTRADKSLSFMSVSFRRVLRRLSISLLLFYTVFSSTKYTPAGPTSDLRTMPFQSSGLRGLLFFWAFRISSIIKTEFCCSVWMVSSSSLVFVRYCMSCNSVLIASAPSLTRLTNSATLSRHCFTSAGGSSLVTW